MWTLLLKILYYLLFPEKIFARERESSRASRRSFHTSLTFLFRPMFSGIYTPLQISEVSVSAHTALHLHSMNMSHVTPARHNTIHYTHSYVHTFYIMPNAHAHSCGILFLHFITHACETHDFHHRWRQMDWSFLGNTLIHEFTTVY